MMKFMCIFVCAFAAASASLYGGRNHGYGAPVGALAYQVQPALTVKALVPAGGYGGNRGSYGYGRELVEVPVSNIYTNSRHGYGYGQAPRVDGQSIGLAKLSLAAPRAGAPLVWNEPRPRIEPIYAPNIPVNYGRGEEAEGASAAAASSSVAGQKGRSGYGRKSVY